MASLVASRRVLPDGRTVCAASRLLNVRLAIVRTGFTRSIGSCMLDDRSSTMTMSRPRDEISASEYGSTGSMSASPVSASAAASVTNGSARRIDARLARSIAVTVVDAANARRARQRRTRIAANAATSHHPRSGRRKRTSGPYRHDLPGLFDRRAAFVNRRELAGASVAGALAGGEQRRHQIDRHILAARRQRRSHFLRGQSLGWHAADVVKMLAHEGADA